LSSDGFDVWLDEERLLPGQNWAIEIEKAVKNSQIVVVCLSKSSTTKTGFVQREIRIALDAADERPDDAIFVVPVRLENCDVPEGLRKWQRVDLFDSKGYQRLVLALRSVQRAEGGGT
jgi:hypothetical protein